MLAEASDSNTTADRTVLSLTGGQTNQEAIVSCDATHRLQTNAKHFIKPVTIRASARTHNERLMKLYDQAGDLCLRNPSRDVQIIVACKSMTVYGLALNEKGWCYGKKQKANAFKKWHECEKNSDRFSESSLAEF